MPDASRLRMMHQAVRKAVNIYGRPAPLSVAAETRESKLALSWLRAPRRRSLPFVLLQRAMPWSGEHRDAFDAVYTRC
jgi:hypothetical protein